MQKYMIERDIPGIGDMSPENLGDAALASNKALAQLAPYIQWQHSFVAGDKSFCVYLATSEDAIQRHAKLSGFPASKITPIQSVIDPSSATR